MQKQKRKFIRVSGVAALLASLFLVAGIAVAGEYPADYQPSKPAATGDTNVLTRFGAITTYMNDKLEAAGGKDSPQCYRNCLTVGLNDALKCIESKGTYAASESCEQDSAQKMSACDPKCQ
ncbi:MAG: hypothetical protein AB7G75_12645 [Candidatus Binatia bacterium]